MESLLQIRKVDKYYGSRENITKALSHISFDVEEGEFLGIMGASGSGKTTLLNAIATIHHVTAGHIYLDGTDITELNPDNLAEFRKKNLGFVFQDFNLLDNFTLEENIGLALALAGEKKEKIAEKVKKMASDLGIEGVLKKFPSEVSGGERQRCACARAMMNQPRLLLADEPTGALDSHSAQTLLEAFTKLNIEKKATILMVTHDVFSASYCSRVLFLRDGQIFTEIRKADKKRKDFFQEILDVVTLMGGEM